MASSSFFSHCRRAILSFHKHWPEPSPSEVDETPNTETEPLLSTSVDQLQDSATQAKRDVKMAFFDKGNFRAHHISLVAMIIGFLSGYDSGVAGGILTFKSFQKSFGFSDGQLSQVQSLTVSLQVLGCFLSCFIASFIVERFGRKRSIIAFALVFILGVVIQVAPTDSLGAWYFARIWSGLGQGSLTVAVPIYTAEMAPPKLRGRLGSFYQWMYTLGIFIAYWVNYGMGKDVDPLAAKQWQIPVGLQLVSGSCLFFGMLTVPESTRWYLKRGRKDEAWKSLTWVRALENDDVQAEFAEMQAGLEAEHEVKSGLRRTEIFRGENRSRVIQGSLAFFFQQATGGSALAYFSPQFFQLLVGSGERDLLLTTIFGAVKFGACSIFIIFIATWVGRKKPLMFGALFMFACMLPIAVILATTPFGKITSNASVPSSGIATVALVMLNVMAYNLSWGPLPWVRSNPTMLVIWDTC